MPLLHPMKRAAIIVRDMPASLAFWRDMIGLRVWAEGRIGPDHPSFHKLLAVKPCHARYVILNAPPVALGMVGLFELREPAPTATARRDSEATLNVGEAVLVFTCDDIGRIAAAVGSAGLPVLCPPTRFQLPELGIESREMTFRDPNGVAVNVIEPVSGRNATGDREQRLDMT